MNIPTSAQEVSLKLQRPGLAELVTLVVAALSGVVGAINYVMVGEFGGLAGVALGLAAVVVVRRWPWVGVGLVTAAPLTGAWLGADPLVLWSMAAFIALVAALRGLSPLPVGAVTGVGSYLAVVLWQQGGWLTALPLLSFVVAVAFASIGTSLRVRGRYYAEVQARADDLLATREAEAERRVAEERLRIAHDLHDTLGHEVALVSMSVGAAEVHLDSDPAQAKADLAQARERIQKVLQETQRTLTVLRNPAENVPAADYGQIVHLVEEFRQAGMDVTASIAEEPAGIDPEVSAAAYRVVQEALVNARKHGTGIVRLAVTVARGNVHIEAVNRRSLDTSDEQTAGGYGLIGMRERAASAGGRIDIDSDDALFTLRAVLPVRGRTS